MNPTPQQIINTRNNARITQTEAAEMVHSKLRTWQSWESGQSKMHQAIWELFKLKLSK